MTTVLFSVLLLVILAIYLYMQRPEFGKAPAGKRLEMMNKSSHYKNGRFHNMHNTPMLTEGYSITDLVYDQFFKKFPRRTPADSIPCVKTDLSGLPQDDDVLVWFGHSSYFLQTGGKRFLVDPVFSENASPVPGTNRSFKGSNAYAASDMPQIDYLLITHDHYDHLDYETVTALKEKVKTVVCGLGVGAHFERWGFAPDKIIEKDWNDSIVPEPGITIHITPARHFSGRGFKRNNTLWVSFILQTPALKVFMGGDSGYDTHFAEIGHKHGPFDLAILENGQYNPAWKNIHSMPGEVLKAAQELKAKRLFPVHVAKFRLAQHPWDEPLTELCRLNEGCIVPLVTPLIGEAVNLDEHGRVFPQWWKGVN
ncbi:MAG: MBL fold metallo-hydrolase [Prolixibacteraceae bacterium]